MASPSSSSIVQSPPAIIADATATPLGPTHHEIVLPNGDVKRYLLRGLIEVANNAKLDDYDDDDGSDADEGEGMVDDGRNDDMIPAWAAMCASSFAYKSNPPSSSYFARHYYNDPRRDASLIRVMMTTTTTSTPCGEGVDADVVGMDDDDDDDDEDDCKATTKMMTMASSVRIFRRTLSCGTYGDATLRYEAGGIGEVCTRPDHRGRGLSTILMHDAMDVMTKMSSNAATDATASGMACSFLHASSDFRRYYNKVGGYTSVTSEWSVVDIKLRNLVLPPPVVDGEKGGDYDDDNDNRNNNGNDVRRARHDATRIATRLAEFPRDAHALHRLHAEYSERRFVTIVRSLEYWIQYVSAELDGTLWVLVEGDGMGRGEDDDAVDEGTASDDIVAWLSIRERGDGRYQLREFGTDAKSVSTTYALNGLLRAALLARTKEGTASEDGREMASLSMPTFVLREMLEETTNDDHDLSSSIVNVDNATEENDDGWMYVVFDESTAHASVVDLITRADGRIPHLIWPTDSF
jgi:predicted GNAT family N-acyltransferase